METSILERTLQKIEHAAENIKAPCHDGELLFRRWRGPANAETVLLVHGGSGSWLHWLRNIRVLQQHYDVITVDLPGLGDSAALPAGYTAADAVNVVVNGTRKLTDGKPFHIVAFSWGCAISAQSAIQLGDQLQSLMLIGPASLGDIPRRGMMKPLIRRTPDMSEDEVHTTQRENLARLMIYDRSQIDELAIYIQTLNTHKARFNSRQFSQTRLVLDGVAQTQVPVKVVYGQFDAPALPDIAGKKEVFVAQRENVEFEVIVDAGHWAQYEKADTFNDIALRWLSVNSLRNPS